MATEESFTFTLDGQTCLFIAKDPQVKEVSSSISKNLVLFDGTLLPFKEWLGDISSKYFLYDTVINQFLPDAAVDEKMLVLWKGFMLKSSGDAEFLVDSGSYYAAARYKTASFTLVVVKRKHNRLPDHIDDVLAEARSRCAPGPKCVSEILKTGVRNGISGCGVSTEAG